MAKIWQKEVDHCLDLNKPQTATEMTFLGLNQPPIFYSDIYIIYCEHKQKVKRESCLFSDPNHRMITAKGNFINNMYMYILNHIPQLSLNAHLSWKMIQGELDTGKLCIHSVLFFCDYPSSVVDSLSWQILPLMVLLFYVPNFHLHTKTTAVPLVLSSLLTILQVISLVNWYG